MFASSQNIENAFIYADKALGFAFGRRLQSLGKHEKVRSKDHSIPPHLKLIKYLGTERMTIQRCSSIIARTRSKSGALGRFLQSC